MSTHDRPDEGATEHLAARLGWEVAHLARVLGGTWRRDDTAPVFHDFDADPSGGEGVESGGWYVAGDPPQLMLRLSAWHGLFLARPRGDWAFGTHGLIYLPEDETYVGDTDPDDPAQVERLTAVVRRLLTARRRTFRYCRYCWEPTPPEERVADDLCMGCATAWEHVVF